MWSERRAGVTTLGRARGCPGAHHDTDDYFINCRRRPIAGSACVADRLRLMREVFLDRSDWVLSGSLDDWNR
jgi:hypothetical protein